MDFAALWPRQSCLLPPLLLVCAVMPTGRYPEGSRPRSPLAHPDRPLPHGNPLAVSVSDLPCFPSSLHQQIPSIHPGNLLRGCLGTREPCPPSLWSSLMAHSIQYTTTVIPAGFFGGCERSFPLEPGPFCPPTVLPRTRAGLAGAFGKATLMSLPVGHLGGPEFLPTSQGCCETSDERRTKVP